MNVIISGALQGLGACLTKSFLDNGDKVFAIIMPNSGLGELSPHEHMHIIEADLSIEADMITAFAVISKATGCIDVLCNVAGILLNKEGFVTQDTYQNLQKTLAVNTIAPIYMNNLFLPLMEKSKSPVFINICSESKNIDDAGFWFPAYCISKTALAQYCFCLKSTFAQMGFDARVFAVHPGRMSTAMGGSNSEITPQISANGILEIAKGNVLKNNNEIYINYLGEPILESNRGNYEL